MSRVSFTEVWDGARAFVVKEWSLLAPVALACFALPMLLMWIVLPPQPKTLAEQMPSGPWVFWLLPYLLLAVFGSMTLAAMTLVPAISVGEALRRAFARMPTALGVMGLLVIAILLLSVVVDIVASVVAAAAGWGLAGGLPLAMALVFVGSLVISVRLAVLWPAVIDSEEGALAAVRRSLRLTTGQFWRLFGLMLLAVAVTTLLEATVKLAGGSVLLLLGQLVGSAPLGAGLAHALDAIVVSLWLMMVVVYTAFLYRAFGSAETAP